MLLGYPKVRYSHPEWRVLTALNTAEKRIYKILLLIPTVVIYITYLQPDWREDQLSDASAFFVASGYGPRQCAVNLFRGSFNVSVRTFENFEIGVLLSSTQPAAYSGPLIGAAETDTPFSAAEMERLSESNVEGPRCMRGLITGIGLELVMALCLYGVWHLWHILHFTR